MPGMHEKIVRFLAQVENPAADQALGFALYAEADSPLAADMAKTLLHRGTDDAVFYLVRVYHKLDRDIQQSLIELCPGISGALRRAARDPDPQVRSNCLTLTSASRQPKLAYVLSLLLHDDMPVLRAGAGEAMRSMASALLKRVQKTWNETEPAEKFSPSIPLADDLHQLFLTLENALEHFSSHLRTEVIEAAMMFGSLIPDSLWSKFTSERSRVGRAAVEILSRSTHFNYAGFAFRALTDPELGKSVVRVIAAERNCEFIRRWLNFSWYRFDLNVRRHLARIREFHWLAGNLQPLMESSPDLQIRFVDLLMLTSVANTEKLEILGSLLVARDPLVQEHVVATLISCDIPDANKVLSRAVTLGQAIQFSARAERMAQRHLRRVDLQYSSENKSQSTGENHEIIAGIEQYFDPFWLAFDRLDLSTFRGAVERLQRLDATFADRLREKFASAEVSDRNRALLLVRRAKLTETFASEVYRLCKDEDVIVRSSAVSALADLPGSVSEQKLIEALDDENLRVQANAIEALEACNSPALVQLIENKLTSPNNRIRANAIKAILKPQYMLAIQALSAMLDHPDATFRRSALWAVTKTVPLHLVDKVNRMAHHDPDSEIQAMARDALVSLVRYWRKSRNQEQQVVSAGAGDS